MATYGGDGPITILFTDIEGATQLLFDGGDEIIVERIRCHQELVQDLIGEHGGEYLKWTGDGVMAAFRSPRKAIACAVAIQMATEAAAVVAGDQPINLRVGLNTGEVATAGGELRGSAIHVAARIMARATGGQILVSDVTRQLAGPMSEIGFISRGRVQLKGVPGRVGLFEVQSAVADVPQKRGLANRAAVDADTPTPIRPPFPLALAPSESTFFVGRDQEVDRLWTLWSAASHTTKIERLRCALVAGEPGIGKTRLAAEVAQTAYADGAIVLYGRCDEDLGVPYQPFVEALGPYVATRPLGLLRTEAGDAASDLAVLMPDIRSRLPDLPPGSKSDPEAERLRLFEGLAGLLDSLSRSAPVLVVLDDLQWAAKPTLLMLRHLVRAPEPMRVAVVGTYRDTDLGRTHPLADTLADLRKASDVARISLTGLAVAEVAAFLEAASGAALDDRGIELADALYEETEGNPFFMTEVLRHLVESGLVRQEGARWTSRVPHVRDLGLPEGVREVVSRRLSRLSKPANLALAVAAVVGHTFSWRVLEAIPEAYERKEELLDSLEEAVRARLLVEEAAEGYRFTHALIRQTLLAELTSAKRIRLHRRIGEAIEKLPNPAEHLEALAFHFAEAAVDGQASKAADYALAAAHRASDHVAYEEGLTVLERGIAAVDAEGSPDDVRRADLLIATAEFRQALGDLPGARDAALEAAQVGRRTSTAAQLARAAILITRQGALGLPDPVVRELCEESLGALDESDMTLRACVMAGLARYRAWDEGQGEPAQRLGTEAVELARGSGDLETLSTVLGIVLFTLYGTETLAELFAWSDELVAVAVKTRDARSRSDGLAARALARLASGDSSGFEEDSTELERFATDERLRPKQAIAMSLRVIQKLMQGAFDEAQTLSSRMLEIGSQDPNIPNLRFGHQVILAQELGRQAELVPAFKAFAEQRPGLATSMEVLTASFLAQLGEYDEARQYLRRLTQDNLASLPRDATWVASVCFLIETAARLKEVDLVPMLHHALAPYAGQLPFVGRSFVLGAADRYLGMLSAMLGRLDEAESHYVAALKLERRLASLPLQARTQVWYARLLADRGLPGDLGQADSLLAASLVTAEDLGMAGLADEIRGLLNS